MFLDQGRSTWDELSALIMESRQAHELGTHGAPAFVYALLTGAAFPRPTQVQPGESTEMKWLAENAGVLEPYRGEWLLISGDMLVAHSAEFTDIERAASELGIASPFVYYVPTEGEQNFIG